MTIHTTPPDLDAFAVHQHFRDRLPMWVVTAHPSDHPDGYVARMHLTLPEPEATTAAIFGDTLEEVREAIPFGLFAFAPMPGDDPVIVETWL